MILASVALGVLGLTLTASAAEIIAHRGASHDAPENTLASIKLGWEQGADAVEVDIHVSKDGKIVILHDDSTGRTAGAARKVVDQTLDELRALDVGAWKGERWKGLRIPTLEEALATVPTGKRLVIEIKCGEEVLPELERVLDASGKRGQAVIIAFSYPVIRAAKARMPDLPAYWLYGFSAREKVFYGHPSLDQLIAKAKDAGVDGLDVNYKGPLTRAFVEKLEAEGLKLIVYTVNDPAAARQLVEIGVAGITTDRPAFLREELAE